MTKASLLVRQRLLKDGIANVEMNTLWISGLTMALSVVGWVLREKAAELHRVTILLNRTREEIAKEYVTKAEVHADINRVLDRLDKLSIKLDRMIEMNNASNK